LTGAIPVVEFSDRDFSGALSQSEQCFSNQSKQLAGTRIESSVYGIMTASMTISASSTIPATLINGLNLRLITISNALFPDDVVYPRMITELHRGDCISDSHLPGTLINRAILKNFDIDRHVVHSRDPRSSLVSITRHVASARKPEHRFLYHPLITPGPEFFSRNLKWQVDWFLDNAIDRIVQWTEDWLDAGEVEGSNILFTCFEQFAADNETFYRCILDFYKIDPERFDWTAVATTNSLLFNRGSPMNGKLFSLHSRKKSDRKSITTLYRYVRVGLLSKLW
jgi:hypothetical protein